MGRRIFERDTAISQPGFHAGPVRFEQGIDHLRHLAQLLDIVRFEDRAESDNMWEKDPWRVERALKNGELGFMRPWLSMDGDAVVMERPVAYEDHAHRHSVM